MDNIDEIAAYKNENGSFDVTMSITNSDGTVTQKTWTDMHLTMEMKYTGEVRLVFES